MAEFSALPPRSCIPLVEATLKNCSKMQDKFIEGTSQYTLLKNRIRALEISLMMLEESSEINNVSTEDLVFYLEPIESIIRKCMKAESNMNNESHQYQRIVRTIRSMQGCKQCYVDEIARRTK